MLCEIFLNKNLHVTCDMWHMTFDTWHMIHKMGWTFSPNVRSLTFKVWKGRFFEEIFTEDDLVSTNKQTVNRLIMARAGELFLPHDGAPHIQLYKVVNSVHSWPQCPQLPPLRTHRAKSGYICLVYFGLKTFLCSVNFTFKKYNFLT